MGSWAGTPTQASNMEYRHPKWYLRHCAKFSPFFYIFALWMTKKIDTKKNAWAISLCSLLISTTFSCTSSLSVESKLGGAHVPTVVESSRLDQWAEGYSSGTWFQLSGREEGVLKWGGSGYRGLAKLYKKAIISFPCGYCSLDVRSTLRQPRKGRRTDGKN